MQRMFAISKSALSTSRLSALKLIRSPSVLTFCSHPCRSLSTNHKPLDAPGSSNNDLHRREFKTKHPDEKSTCDINSFTYRSHACGQINDSLVGRDVNLCGWLEFQRLGKFIVLRDSYGTVQLFIKNKELQEIVKTLHFESVLQVKGKVNLRPAKDVNPNLINGNVEVCVEEMNVLNTTMAPLPFLTRDFIGVNEKVRLEYRYLDLRRPKLCQNLRTRSNFIMKLRNCLADEFGFVEVETPTLFKATPGGAQEFIVPTRFPNHFYSLVQSPQQFKQLLMIGGVDRYFQVARCYRDEGTKADRQPEFTQLDIEMSFTSIDHVIELIEKLLHKAWPVASEISQIATPFHRMDYQTAMDKYGVDKPDLRSDIEIQPLRIDDSSDQESYLLVIPQEYDETFAIKSFINDDLPSQITTLHYQGKLNYFKWSSEPFQQDLAKNIIQQLKSDFTFKDNDFLWIARGKRADCLRMLGRVRASCIDAIEEEKINSGHPRKLSFLWVVNFPLFLANEETGRLESSHHPFTAPKASHADLIYTAPCEVIGQNFDLVINGREIGGGSIRIIDHRLQRYILKDILKCDSSAMEYFMDALNTGCPPHGGFAIGLDRLVALICHEPTIRDVIAFPKAAHGKDLMSSAPCPIDNELRKLYHLSPQ